MNLRHRGLTVIELMIAIALLALLSLAGLTFTGSWVNSNRVYEGQALIEHAYSRTKALAFRNQHGKTNTKSAAAVCLSGKTLTLHEASDTAQASCSGTQVWTAELPSNVELKVSGNTLSCICLTNHGELTNFSEASHDCSGCTTSTPLTVTVTAGSESADIILL